MTGLKWGLAGLRELKARIDPNKRLEELREEYVLEEFPRIFAVMETRLNEIAGAGCTPQEVVILIHQTLESGSRTLDEEKRKRLFNVLVNGLCAKQWNKVQHRLMLRYASDLEEEHVDQLRRTTAFGRGHAIGPLRRAIERELISRGLLEEKTKQVRNPKWKPPPAPKLDGRGGIVVPRDRRGERIPEFIDEISVSQSDLGRQFLEHLRDPEAHDASE